VLIRWQGLLRCAIGVAVAPTLTACGAIAFGIANAPAHHGDFDRFADIAYGANPRQRLDLYVPQGRADPPVVVFWYGGSWERGRKEAYRFAGAALAEAGYLAVIPDYRLYPEVRFPGFVEDGALALKWVQDNAARYGGNSRQLFVMGHSAGAHLAALLALDERHLRRAGGDPRAILGLIGLSGPYALVPDTRRLNDIFAAPATARDWQPVQHASPRSPPALLLHGGSDSTVSPSHASVLATSLRAQGVAAELKLYPQRGHAVTVAALSWVAKSRAPVLDDVRRFIEGQTAAPPVSAPGSGAQRPVG